MTVAELKSQLDKLPNNIEVLFDSEGDYKCHLVSLDDVDIVEFEGSNAVIISTSEPYSGRTL